MSDSACLKVMPPDTEEELNDLPNTCISGILELTAEDYLPVNMHRHMRVVEFAKDYIQKNFWNKISVAEIAKEVFVSQYHFSRIFKKHTQCSPYQYLLNVRLHHARELMSQTDLPIKEISFQSGFASIDYFSAAFARRYTVCPSSYRKMLLWNEMENRR